MHEIGYRVRFSDIATNDYFRYSNLPKLFQDASIEDSESIGVGLKYLLPKHLAWLLTSWQIEINRLPEYDETLRIRTWPYDFKGAFGYRNYDMLGRNDEVLVKAYALWIHTDIEKMHPATIPPEEYEKYTMEQKIDMEYLSRKIALPQDMELVDKMIARKCYSDMYHHINNAMYVDLAADYLPDTKDIAKRIRVDYRMQFTQGSTMIVKKGFIGKSCIIAFFGEDDSLHVSTEFSYE